MAAACVVSPAPNAAGSSQALAHQDQGSGTGWRVHAHAQTHAHTCAHMRMPGQRGWLQLEGCLPSQGQAGRREAGKQPELGWGVQPQPLWGCRQAGPPRPRGKGQPEHPGAAPAAAPWPSRAQAKEGSRPDRTRAGKCRGEAAPARGAAGVNPGEPSSCSHQGTQAHPSATEGLFWELAGDKVRGLCPGELSLHGGGRGPASPARGGGAARG